MAPAQFTHGNEDKQNRALSWCSRPCGSCCMVLIWKEAKKQRNAVLGAKLQRNERPHRNVTLFGRHRLYTHVAHPEMLSFCPSRCQQRRRPSCCNTCYTHRGCDVSPLGGDTVQHRYCQQLCLSGTLFFFIITSV